MTSQQYREQCPQMICGYVALCAVEKCPHKVKHLHSPMCCHNACRTPNGVAGATCKEYEDEQTQTAKG